MLWSFKYMQTTAFRDNDAKKSLPEAIDRNPHWRQIAIAECDQCKRRYWMCLEMQSLALIRDIYVSGVNLPDISSYTTSI